MAEKPAVHPDIAVGEALRAVARDMLSEARAALDEQEKPDAVAVHDYRKAMKRWRALLRLLQPFLGDQGRRLRIEARDFARELAGARDAQSAIEALEDLVEAEAALSPRTVASIRGRLDAIRLSAEAATLTQAVRARLIVGSDNAGAAIDGMGAGTADLRRARARADEDISTRARGCAAGLARRRAGSAARVAQPRGRASLSDGAGRAAMAEVRPRLGGGSAAPARPARRRFRISRCCKDLPCRMRRSRRGVRASCR